MSLGSLQKMIQKKQSSHLQSKAIAVYEELFRRIKERLPDAIVNKLVTKASRSFYRYKDGDSEAIASYYKQKLDQEYDQASMQDKPNTQKGRLLAEAEKLIPAFEELHQSIKEKARLIEEYTPIFREIVRRNILKAIPQKNKHLRKSDLQEPNPSLYENKDGTFDSSLSMNFRETFRLHLARSFWSFLQTLPFSQREHQGTVTKKLKDSPYGKLTGERPYFETKSQTERRNSGYGSTGPEISYYAKYSEGSKYHHHPTFTFNGRDWPSLIERILYYQVLPVDAIFQPNGQILLVGQDELLGKDMSVFFSGSFTLVKEIETLVFEEIRSLYLEENAPKLVELDMKNVQDDELYAVEEAFEKRAGRYYPYENIYKLANKTPLDILREYGWTPKSIEDFRDYAIKSGDWWKDTRTGASYKLFDAIKRSLRELDAAYLSFGKPVPHLPTGEPENPSPMPSLETKTQQSESATPSTTSTPSYQDPFEAVKETYKTQRGKEITVWRIPPHPDLPQSVYRVPTSAYKRLREKYNWYTEADGWRVRSLEDLAFLKGYLQKNLDKLGQAPHAKTPVTSTLSGVPKEIQNFLENTKYNGETQIIGILDPEKYAAFYGKPSLSGNMITLTDVAGNKLSLSFDALIKSVNSLMSTKHLLLPKKHADHPLKDRTALHNVFHPDRSKEDTTTQADVMTTLINAKELENLYKDLYTDEMIRLSGENTRKIGEIAKIIAAYLYKRYITDDDVNSGPVKIKFVPDEEEVVKLQSSYSKDSPDTITITLPYDATYAQIVREAADLFGAVYTRQLEQEENKRNRISELQAPPAPYGHALSSGGGLGEWDLSGSIAPIESGPTVLTDKQGKPYQEIEINLSFSDPSLVKVSPAPEGKPAYDDPSATASIELSSRKAHWTSRNPEYYNVQVVYPKQGTLEPLFGKALQQELKAIFGENRRQYDERSPEYRQAKDAAIEKMEWFLTKLTKEQIAWLLKDYKAKHSKKETARERHQENLKKLINAVVKKYERNR